MYKDHAARVILCIATFFPAFSNGQTNRLQELMDVAPKQEAKEATQPSSLTKEQLLNAIRNGALNSRQSRYLVDPNDKTGRAPVDDLMIAHILQESYGLAIIPTDRYKASTGLFEERKSSTTPFVSCRSKGNITPTEAAGLISPLYRLSSFKYFTGASQDKKGELLAKFQQEISRIETYCNPDLVSSYKRLVEDVIAAVDEDVDRIMARNIEVEAHEAALQAQRETDVNARMIHDEAVKTGKLPIITIRDAMLRYSAPSGRELAVSPLVTADGKVYQVAGILRSGPADTLLVEVSSRNDLAYFTARTTGSTKIEPGYQLRFNESVAIVGKYVDNQTYRTVRGEQRVAPLFEAIAIGPAK